MLGWTMLRLRHPQQAHRWTWRYAAASTQLRLARAVMAGARLPWQHPQTASHFALVRFQQAYPRRLLRLGILTLLPKPCGRSPGRPCGRRSGLAPRAPILKWTA